MMYRTKKMNSNMAKHLERFPSIHKSGSVKGMKKHFWGVNALCVRCGNYVYLVDERTYAMAD